MEFMSKREMKKKGTCKAIADESTLKRGGGVFLAGEAI